MVGNPNFFNLWGWWFRNNPFVIYRRQKYAQQKALRRIEHLNITLGGDWYRDTPLQRYCDSLTDRVIYDKQIKDDPSLVGE